MAFGKKKKSADNPQQINSKKKKRRKNKGEQDPEEIKAEKIKTFLDMYLPGHVRIHEDYITQDNKYRKIWAIKSYPAQTNEQAILADLGMMSGVTIHLIGQQMNSQEEQKVIQNAANKNRYTVNSVNDTQQNVQAQEDFQSITDLIRQLHRDKERLEKVSVFIEMSADTMDRLNELEIQVRNFMQSSAITYDRLLDRQAQGFLSVMIGGQDEFKGEFSRAIPQISMSNLYPFSYTGKSDPHGFFIGKDINGSYILTDIDKRDATHTNSNVAILGNSGQGKSYLSKGLVCNFVEEGKNLIILDPEGEYPDLVRNLGGTYLDLMEGDYMINVLEPKAFTMPDDGESVNDDSNGITKTYTTKGKLAQHISFLRDFFKTYKTELSGTSLDILEMLLSELYTNVFHIDDSVDISTLPKDQFPTMQDLWKYAYNIYKNYDPDVYMYSREDLKKVLLAIKSICDGTQARYFNGHTNVKDTRVLGFGLKGIMEADESLKNAMLFNVLSYMSNKLLVQRNTVALLDEFYLFLGSKISTTYVRNCMKRVRKYDSIVMIASQNIDDFLNPEIASFTKPLLEIPTHKFLFNPGNVDVKQFKNLMQLEDNEYKVIEMARRGTCLYQCGNERYSLQVSFPKWKSDLFGNGGGN